eukprot:1482006-Ditylum_brightwellii.AAC.1
MASSEKVEVVKGHVAAVYEMIEELKKKDLRNAEQEADMRVEKLGGGGFSYGGGSRGVRSEGGDRRGDRGRGGDRRGERREGGHRRGGGVESRGGRSDGGHRRGDRERGGG